MVNLTMDTTAIDPGTFWFIFGFMFILLITATWISIYYKTRYVQFKQAMIEAGVPEEVFE